jgi:hypothetical protein
MKKFSRPSPDEYAPYFQTYLDKVPAGVDDIMAHLKRRGLIWLTLLRGMDDAQAEYRYAADKWSVKEMVGHLIDTERVFAFRSLWIARGAPEDQPGMDENLWGRTAGAHARPLAGLWREQHVCRTDHVYLFRSFDAEAVGRQGTADGKVLSVRAVPWIIAGHEKHHLDVLKERYGIG